MKIPQKIGWTLLATIGCATPAWIFWGVHALMEPNGFWQTLVLGIAGLFFLSGLQIFLFGVWCVLLLGIWTD